MLKACGEREKEIWALEIGIYCYQVVQRNFQKYV